MPLSIVSTPLPPPLRPVSALPAPPYIPVWSSAPCPRCSPHKPPPYSPVTCGPCAMLALGGPALAALPASRSASSWRRSSSIASPAVPGGQDRKSVVKGKSVSVRVDLGGRRIIKKKKKKV